MNKEVVYDGTADEQYDNRSRVDILRDTKDRITGYNFRILIKDKKPLEGHLSREEAEKLYRLYSSEGANLQQRSVNRELGGRFTITQFRKIVSAFKITKSISPFPPHMIEENEVDDLVQLNIQAKEDDFLKKFEQEKSDLYKKKYVDLLKENQKLKNSYTSAEYMTQNVEPIRFETIPGVKGGKSLLVYLSDIHAGAYVSSEGVYDNAYGEDEIHRRLCLVLDKIASYSDLDNIVIFNLGDAIDGYNASTTRPSSSHVLPQNMSNKEQGRVVMSQLGGFFKYILENIPHNSLQFYSVGHSNHGGDFEHSIMTALSIMLENIGVKTYVSTRPIDHFKLGDKTIIFAHGNIYFKIVIYF